MRMIRVTKYDADLEYSGHGSQAAMTGTDEDTAERVTFVLNDGELINNLLMLIQRDGAVAIPVADFQVTLVESLGEWDSPGTSPEEES